MPTRNEAEDLLDRTIAGYRVFSSYCDSGFVQIGAPGEPARYSTTFETLFARPGLFRFKFQTPHPHPPLAHLVTTTICGFDGIAAYLSMSHYGGRKASVETYAIAYMRRDDAGTTWDLVQGLRYLDDLERRGDEWRISRRVLTVEWERRDVVVAAKP